MKERRMLLPVATFFLLLASESGVASETSATPEDARASAIVGATILPVSGPMIRRGTIVWKAGKIERVGAELEPPEGATVYPGEGLYVAPGFVAVIAAGLGAERTQGNFQNSLDPWDLSLRIALANGITTVQLVDSPFSGGFGQDGPLLHGSRSAIIKLAHGDLSSMLVREPALNYFSLPSRQLELNYFLLRERFRKAADYIKERREAEAKKAKPPRLEQGLETYVAVLENERPTVFSPRSVDEVRVVLELAEQYGLDVILHEPDDAWTMAPRLAAAGIPVLVKSRGRDFDFSTSGPVLDRGDMAPVRRPAAFARAGVEVSILPYRRGISLGGLAGRDLATLAMDAAFAVRGGMSEEEALRAVTLNPARVLGIAGRVGSLETGKDADLLLLDGHPLDYRAFVLKAFIHGKLYYEREASRIYSRVPRSGER